MSILKDRLKRFWFYFRTGHSLYLVFALSFINFIVINYKLLIEQIPQLNIFKHIWIFAVITILIYTPVAIIVGFLHKKKQLPSENLLVMESNPQIYQVLPKSKEALTYVPLQIELLKYLMRNAPKEDIPRLKELEKKFENLMKGGAADGRT